MAWGKDKERNRQALRWLQKEDGRATGWLFLRGYGGEIADA